VQRCPCLLAAELYPTRPIPLYAAVVENDGVNCENAPGFHETPAGKLYLACLRDPEGNKVLALHRPG
jgi:hypothetical protein